MAAVGDAKSSSGRVRGVFYPNQNNAQGGSTSAGSQ